MPNEIPIYATHTDAQGNILATRDFSGARYQTSTWLQGLDIHPGDKIEFFRLAIRSDELPREAIREPVTPLIAADEQPL